MCEGADTNQILSWAWAGRSSSPVVKKQTSIHCCRAVETLCKIVIPLQDVKEVPNQPPIKLLTRPNSFTLGTKSSNLIQLNDGAWATEEHIRLNAMLERD